MTTPRLLFLLAFTCTAIFSTAQVVVPRGKEPDDPDVVKRLVLIGDAGALNAENHHPVVEAVEKWIPLGDKTTVVYLGDNLYRHGLPDEMVANYQNAKAVLDSQANIANHTSGPVYFIPGNHDWMNGQPGGYSAILRQQHYLNSLHKPNLHFLPQDGCPGPEVVDIDSNVVLVIIDSQWWIHENDKPGVESDCNVKTKQEIISELQSIVTDNYKKLIIFACHHPFRSNGVHGGYYGLKQHIFPFTDMHPHLYIPLPVLGSIYPISRGIFGTPEDIAHPSYSDMIARVDAVLKTHPNVIHVAGHEHSLQWIEEDSNSHYLISGAGCKHTRAQKSQRTKYVSTSNGFCVLEIHRNKDVIAKFYTVAKDSMGLQYSDTVLNFGKLPKVYKEDTTVALHSFRDSVTAPASLQYHRMSGFKKIFAGKNYRREWSEPVSFPVFRINKTHGGMKATGMGGGQQTKSLQLKDKDGKEWVLRTIDKDPTKAIPDFLRGSLAADVVQDMISAGHPYGALPVPPLAEAAGIIHANPEYFYVPDDRRLGDYRNVFAGKICLLEERNPAPDAPKTRSTNKLFNKMREDNDQVVEQRALLQARLLDVLIGDWDRHFDQWRWAEYDTGKGKIYFPVPRDRDQAFFRSDGLLLKVASQRFLPWMRGFRHDYNDITRLVSQARDLDRIFMNALDRHLWEEGVTTFTNKMTNPVIADAVQQLPPEIRTMDSASMTARLRSRRDLLPKRAMTLYRFLSRRVNVLGSNEQEYFTVKGNDSGMLIQVHARRKNEDRDTSMLIYSRQIDPKETKEVRMYGFNGNDVFDIDEATKGRTRFRIIGGRGNDTFNIRGHVHNDVYDLSTEHNIFLADRRTKKQFSDNPQVNEFSFPDYVYNQTTFPSINFGYNPDDGLLAGIGFYKRTYGFRKDPFQTEHRLSTLFAFTDPAFQIRYGGTFISLLRPYDVVVHAWLQDPTLTNFFGLGNQTVRLADKSLYYYRVRYKTFDADVLLRRRPFKVLSIGAGPAYNYYWNNEHINKDKILEHPEQVGLDSAGIYTDKAYLGGKLVIDINNQNSEVFPTRGINWHNELLAYGGMNDASKPLTTLQSHMTIYTTLAQYSRLTGVIRLGGGHIFSKQYEWFQALGLGQNNFLRGFRKNRFAGDGLAYGSLELRAKIADVNSHILPGSFGVLGFDDVGRVWKEGETSRRWHNSYGGGLYYLPFNQFILSATMAFGEEQPILNLSIGTRLNITF